MLEFTDGDLFDANTEALVNAVNTVGVLGEGLALQFATRFPEIVQPYKLACESGALVIGRVLIVQLPPLSTRSIPSTKSIPKYIVNFPTKEHWKSNSKLENIKSGLKSLRVSIEGLGISSIALPALGCGLGGLPWKAVRSKIVEAFCDLAGVRIVIFKPR